ncbi:MAG: PEP-CTERM sorting domain-containing protein [Verrucomicrobiota bacterium]|nr:PEP-CTERM sorting domain-containing protein [Verrucomicrobiota bacterium]
MNFTSSNAGISSIDNLRIFNFNQGPGANLGFDNLAIVPEPSSFALLAGPVLLGAWFFLRRRRQA